VHLPAQFEHLGAFGISGQRILAVIQSLDLLGDGEVFVGHGAVGNAQTIVMRMER
jgi:hypothetical protein